jgi:secretion/DNA translocation related TadE-like protein
MIGRWRLRDEPPGSERGSVSIAAVGVMVLVVILSLASADLARVLAVASRAQTAADAAALAAAQALVIPEDGASPKDAAAEYAERNGSDLVSCSCDPGADEATVVVRTAVGRLLLFGNDRVVTAKARAVVDRASTTAG